LGGNDYIAYNAHIANSDVVYYLNNHKDLSIRPYAPLPADMFYIWFPSQKEVIQDINNTMLKVKTTGLIRVQNYLKNAVEPARTDNGIHVLHCCSDPRRRPFEVYTLNSLCTQIAKHKLDVKLTLRLNPMDSTNIFRLLDKFDFVDIEDSGWKWNPDKFVNMPSKEDELFYFKQIQKADILSSLPSTTLVEGVLFDKKTICLIDNTYPDYESELKEKALVIPSTISSHPSFIQIETIDHYIQYLKDMGNV